MRTARSGLCLLLVPALKRVGPYQWGLEALNGCWRRLGDILYVRRVDQVLSVLLTMCIRHRMTRRAETFE